MAVATALRWSKGQADLAASLFESKQLLFLPSCNMDYVYMDYTAEALETTADGFRKYPVTMDHGSSRKLSVINGGHMLALPIWDFVRPLSDSVWSFGPRT